MTGDLKDKGMARCALDMLPEDVSKSLRTRYRTLRIMAHVSGLAATYAFVASKAAKSGSKEAAAYQRVRDHLGARLRDTGSIPADATTPRAVMAAIAEIETEQYLRASEDIELLFAWLARLAEALASEADQAVSEVSGQDNGT